MRRAALWVMVSGLAGLGAGAQPLRVSPAYADLTPHLAVPPFLEDRLIYYNSFDGPGGAPEVDTAQASQARETATGPGGIRGGCALAQQGQHLPLGSEALSPHQPVTASFWWALGVDGQPESIFHLFQLTNGKGFVSHFSRGKGDWCQLERPAAILQVYYLPGIRNVNGIYDRDLAAHLDLRAGVWHHAAVVFSGGSLVEVYTDGQRAWKARLMGRSFSEADNLHQMNIGGRHGLPVALDEVMVWRRALTSDEIRTYVTALRQMQAVAYPH